MTFEDAVQLCHELSENLAKVVELKGDLVMVSPNTSHAQLLQQKIAEISEKIGVCISELEFNGLEKIQDEIGYDEH